MLAPLHLYDSLQSCRGAPPGEAGLEQRDAEAGKVPLEELLTAWWTQLRQTQLDVAPSRLREAHRQASQNRAQRVAQGHEPAERQQAQEP